MKYCVYIEIICWAISFTSLLMSLDNLSTIDLHTLFTDEETALSFVYELDMLYDGGVCESTPNCPGNYEIVDDASSRTGHRLKCSHCKKTKSLFYNSIFTRTHLPINVVVHIIYCWVHEYSCDLAAHECNVNLMTITNFYQACRQAATFWLQTEGQDPIGGNGYNVEIDETLMSKRKNHAGRVLQEIWIFGGICRETHERFAIQVQARDAATLLPIIQSMILPGSIIHSDGWSAYNGIDQLPEGYTHFVVNHTTNFVDPLTGSHTQTIERMWREVKRIKRRYEGISRQDVTHHLAEYLWRECRNVNHTNGLAEAVILIGNCPYY